WFQMLLRKVARQPGEFEHPGLICDGNTTHVGGHVRKHKVSLMTVERALQFCNYRYVTEIAADEGDAGEPGHVEQVERNHPATRPHALRRHLRPPARSRPEVHHRHPGSKQTVAARDLLELERGARASALGTRALHEPIGNMLLHPVSAADAPHGPCFLSDV